MELNQYRIFTERLTITLKSDPRVIGLIALGSMAEVGRTPDVCSDHDFFVITVPSVQESFRTDLTWLPDADQIVLTIRETAHGLKVLYRHPHLIEFAIFDAEEIRIARANDYRVLLDKADVAVRMDQISVPREKPVLVDVLHEVNMVISLCFVAAGRYARGEQMSATVFLKTYALSHLLRALTAVVEAEGKIRLDNLDPFRRFEQVFPEIGTAINAALLLPIRQCALEWLRLIKIYIAPRMSNFANQASEVVQQYILAL
ncbi:MAG: hypothetical protein OHK0023_05670 [Anaerolineae bacterium]